MFPLWESRAKHLTGIFPRNLVLRSFMYSSRSLKCSPGFCWFLIGRLMCRIHSGKSDVLCVAITTANTMNQSEAVRFKAWSPYSSQNMWYAGSRVVMTSAPMKLAPPCRGAILRKICFRQGQASVAGANSTSINLRSPWPFGLGESGMDDEIEHCCHRVERQPGALTIPSKSRQIDALQVSEPG